MSGPVPSPHPFGPAGVPQAPAISLAELRARAVVSTGDADMYGIRAWINSAAKAYEQGDASYASGDLENAYVSYVKGCTIIVEILPKNYQYDMLLSNKDPAYLDLQKHTVGKILPKVEQIAWIIEGQFKSPSQNGGGASGRSSFESNPRSSLSSSNRPPSQPTKQFHERYFSALDSLPSPPNDLHFPNRAKILPLQQPHNATFPSPNQNPNFWNSAPSIPSTSTKPPQPTPASTKPAMWRRPGSTVIPSLIPGSNHSNTAGTPPSSGQAMPKVTLLSLTNNEFPMTPVITPLQLAKYLTQQQNPPSVLLMDVRPKEEFERGCIRHKYIIQVEPLTLENNITSADIESSLTMNPETDKLLFANRNHFDLIVYYDRNSMSFNTPSGVNGYAYMSPLKNLKIAIYENEFTKSLPRMPVLLVGGFEAWRAFAKDKGVYVFKEDGGSRGGSAENTQKKNVASRGMGGGVVPTTAYVPKMPPPGRANTGLTELPPINRTVTDFFHQQSDGNTVQSMVKPNFGPAAPPITQYNGYQASVPPPAQKMNMPIPQPYRPSSVPQPPLVQLRILSDEPMSIDPATAQRNNTAYPGAVSAGVPASAVGTTAAAGATRLSRRNAFIDNPYNGFTSTASTNTLYEPPPPALAPKPNRPVRPPPPLGVPTSPQSPPIPPKNHVPNIDPNAGARPATGQLPMSPSSFSQLGGIKNGNGMVGDAPYYHHQTGVGRMEAIETTSRPREAKPYSEHFRPMKVQCREGSFCGQYMVVAHMNRYLHPFNTPCHDAPFACTCTDVNHAAKFSHVCKYGAGCRELSDSNHMRNFIHIFRTHCSDGANCTFLLNEEHLNLFSHPEIADIRSPCQYRQECPKRSQSRHVAEYTHPSDGPPISSYDDICQDINFSRNAQEIIRATDEYFKDKGQNFQVPEEIVEWIKSFRPAHRVRPKIFKSILAHHHVMSVDHILKLKNPKWASHEARHHPLLRKICEENKCSKSERTQLEDLVECAVLVAHGKSANDPQLPSWETDLNLKIEAVCNQILTSEQMKPLIDLGDRLVKATRDLATNPEGIQYNVDKLMGTNKHVFGILGPHTGHYYGDIILLFKPDIMNHPQSNVSPNAATAFWSGREANNRPFMPTGKPKSDEAIMKFHKSKLHTSCSNWAKAAAADICAQIIETTGKTHISLNDVKSEWLKRESHFVFEAHLPSLIPFSFVDKIIIPKNIWDNNLTAADNQEFRLAFPDPNDVIVFCDPVGGDVDGCLDLTDDRRKLINTAMEHCSSPNAVIGSVYRPLGMSVTLERGKGAICPLPFRFQVAGDGNIYFRARGSEFFLMLTEKQTKESSNSGSRFTFYFGGPKSHILYITRSPPSAHRVTLEKKNWVAHDPNFDRGFSDGDWVNYHIQMDCKQRICMVEHWGHSQIYNRRTLLLNTNPLPENFSFNVQWLGIGVWKNQVSFESIEVHHEPLPKPSCIQWTPQMATNASTPPQGPFPELLLVPSPKLKLLKSLSSAQSASANAPSTLGATAILNADPVRRNGMQETLEGVNHAVCSLQTSCSKYNDAVHCQTFEHPFVMPCPNIATCKRQFVKSSHNQMYSHLCQFGGGCELNDNEHQLYYIHSTAITGADPVRRDGIPGIFEAVNRAVCSLQTSCSKYNDAGHCQTFEHPFVMPCPNITTCKRQFVKSPHNQMYSHLCQFGDGCRELNDNEHQLYYIHPTAITSADPVRRDGIQGTFEAVNRAICRLQTSCPKYNDAGHCRSICDALSQHSDLQTPICQIAPQTDVFPSVPVWQRM